MVSTVKCANVQRTLKVVFWTVDERILSSNYDEIRMIKLDQLNISIITALFKQEENRSIVVCKLEENYNTEWSITVICKHSRLVVVFVSFLTEWINEDTLLAYNLYDI